MKLTQLNSTNLDKAGFEEDYKIGLSGSTLGLTRMRIIFKHGGAYDYYRVPKELYENFLNADSQGVFFHKHIKGKFADEKVG